MKLAQRYILFAVIATLLNLLFQAVSLALYQGVGYLFVAMFWGTAAGLVVKYLLDKWFIFYDKSEHIRDHGKKFAKYTLTGVGTTFIFWGTEWLFDWLFAWPGALYVGAVVGLAIGYLIKYFLDRRYVFNSAAVQLQDSH
ncbi:GtrA family protein [Thiomicrorhabdus xiamenensis]|uniref:GtrA family protein n=1 Tax=Thiomicrorhabdus xiamenensis TaxID=2739063 RepID=A0A7D4P5A3_9GAMM|nr:GtrA family protein [Thiomicrorhabdus xiamenensis]QKI89756.1 GtrA family protein [Thiomicrorhabdus xiamenensis]